MRKAVLFIAMSLDGYIADKEGKVDWLRGQESEADDMQSYDQFIKGVGTVILGWNTYHQVATELSPDVWPYEELESYVITKKESQPSGQINFTCEDVCSLVKKLRQEDGKDIWICGGAKTAQKLIDDNLIDKYHISVIPVILGNGIRLFRECDNDIKLKLIKSQSYNGITDLIYDIRKTEPQSKK